MTDSIAGQTRYRGYLRTLREYESEYAREHIVFMDGWMYDPYEAAAELFAQCFGLTAVFTTSDELAIGFVQDRHPGGRQAARRISGLEDPVLMLEVERPFTIADDP
ncbi:hypothetical protein [Cohnella caldifontis]|uniref:hypothetical protein n=1 Tax=Cohnella caldifontis TaxID=3027471 RepID=UPI0023ED4681|nr:hypothetical protein [Cohnella sp. YIM B05605]